MTVRKRYARHYYTDFYAHGKRIVRKVPGGVTNREVAQQYENDLKLKMLKGEIGISRINPDLSDLIKEYLAFSRTNKALASYQRDEVALRNFISVTGHKKLSDLTPRSIEKYKQTRLETMSKRTVNLEITMLKAMLNKMVELGAIPENPIKAVKKIRGPESKTLEFLTRDEIDVLLPTLLKRKTLTREQLKKGLLEYDSNLDASKVGYHLTTMSSQLGMKKNDFLRQVVAYEYPNYKWEKDNFSLREQYKHLVREVLDEIKSRRSLYKEQEAGR